MEDLPSFYDLEIDDINGTPINLANYKGKKLMLVNVASKCGFTPQYTQLQELHETRGEQIAIIGVPCNDFGWQEPGDSGEIQEFCKLNYGVDFLLTEKVKILLKPHPLYKWLSKKKLNGVASNMVKWNFSKFLINEDGTLHTFYGSSTSPIDEEILDWVG